VGPGTADGIEMGPLITREHLQRVRDYIDVGVKEGATLVVDGRSLQVAGHADGFYLGASLFDRVEPQMRIYREEIFGPVLVVVRVPDLQTALRLVNEHEFGNGTAIFTRDGDAARTFTQSRAGRNGRRERADSGADGLPQLRWLEALAVRRSAHPRP
jgi:malonate-semialdehyde dehydrogenase (acetylating)/methylmalonate-semialdehyde dehydrogenase